MAKVKLCVFFLTIAFALSSESNTNELKIDSLNRPDQSAKILDLIISTNNKFINSDLKVSSHLKNKNEKLFFFFAGYCHYCEHEIPDFLASQQEFQKCRIDLIPYNVDKTQAEAETVVKNWRINLATLWDSNSKVRRFLKIRRIPYLIHTDENGLILNEASGVNQYRKLFHQLKSACLKRGS